MIDLNAPESCVMFTAELERRIIDDVALDELAPCPCDLTAMMCDPNCCCDEVPASVREYVFYVFFQISKKT